MMSISFKKAMAAAMAVPMAMVQTLVPSYAATESTPSANNQSITLSSLTYIAPNDTDQHSDWNKLLSNKLVQVNSASYSVDTANITNILTETAPLAYKDALKSVLSQIKNVKVSYDNIGSTITVSGSLDEIGDVIAQNAQERIGAQIDKAYAAQTDLSALKNIDLSGLKCSGEFKAVIDLSSLSSDTKTNVSYNITAEDGNSYTIGGNNSIFTYVNSKLDYIKNAAENALNLASQNGIDVSAASETLNSYFSSCNEKINSIKNKADALATLNASISSDNIQSLLAQLAQKYPEYADKIPSSATDAASNQAVSDSYTYLTESLNNFLKTYGCSVDIPLSTTAQWLDSLYNVSATVENGDITLVGYFADDQMSELESYYSDMNKDVVSSCKKVTIDVDYASLYTGSGDFSLDIERVLKTEDAQPVTTTTETTTSTETTTTTTETTTTSSETTTTSKDTDCGHHRNGRHHHKGWKRHHGFGGNCFGGCGFFGFGYGFGYGYGYDYGYGWNCFDCGDEWADFGGYGWNNFNCGDKWADFGGCGWNDSDCGDEWTDFGGYGWNDSDCNDKEDATEDNSDQSSENPTFSNFGWNFCNYR